MTNVSKISIFLENTGEFKGMNETYGVALEIHRPNGAPSKSLPPKRGRFVVSEPVCFAVAIRSFSA